MIDRSLQEAGDRDRPLTNLEQRQLDQWLSHLFWLAAKKRAGCRFSLNDLTVREWEGLEILTQEAEGAEEVKAG
jgi:hypothetical protein